MVRYVTLPVKPGVYFFNSWSMNMNENASASRSTLSRRDMLASAVGVLAATAASSPVIAAGAKAGAAPHRPNGWPLSADDWDAQMLFAAVADALNLRSAIHIGHSTGGGEVVRYVARYGKGRVAKAILVSAVPPLMLKTERNPEGTPVSVFDGLRAKLAANRSQFFREVPIPFYGFNRPGEKVIPGVVDNWTPPGM